MLNVLCFFSKYLHGQGVTDMERDHGIAIKEQRPEDVISSESSLVCRGKSGGGHF